MSLTSNKLKDTQICGTFQNIDYPDGSNLATGYFERDLTVGYELFVGTNIVCSGTIYNAGLDTKFNKVDTSLNSLIFKDVIHDISINNLISKNIIYDTSINSIIAKNILQDTSINNILTSSFTGYSSTNRLNMSNVGTGLITNTELNNLTGNTQNINAKFVNLDGGISGLATLINTLTAQVTALTTRVNYINNSCTGCYFIDGNVSSGVPIYYPIVACMKQIYPNDSVDSILLAPGYKLKSYMGVNYSDDGLTPEVFDNTGGTTPQIYSVTWIPNNMSSCYLYYNNQLLLIDPISYPTNPYIF